MALRELGPYRIVSELGSGGMGVVYLAEVVRPLPGLDAGSRVALKVLHAHLVSAPTFFDRFRREARIGMQVVHENVVRTLDANSHTDGDDTWYYLVLEYVEGQTLRSLLEELGRAPEALCRHIGREVARALEAIHAAGAIHRDLKPENVLFTGDNLIKVMDLGLARLLDDSFRISTAGAFAGSVLYAAPEQFAGGEVDPRADLYALGLLLYELATGEHPFAADEVGTIIQHQLSTVERPAAELNPQLTPFFEEVLRRLLAKEAPRRFTSAGELLDVLEKGESCGWWRERARDLRAERGRPLRRLRIERETVVFGRDAELALLATRFEEARDGQGAAVLIEGEAGIGKSRLVDEFLAGLQRRGESLHVLCASYPPVGAATAAGGFSTAFREYLGEEALEEALAQYLRVTPALVPALAAVLRGDPPPEGEEPLTKDSLLTVFVHLARALARERPTVIAIDDLHLATEEGRDLFASLALAAPGHRLLLVGTMRPGVPGTWKASVTQLDHVTTVSLSRLAPKDLAGLLSAALRSERLAEELGWKIAVKSDCNPLFALEIVRGLREGKFITEAPDGSWVRSQVIEKIEVPSSILDLIQARIAELGDADKDLLDVAACCGYEFDPLLVAEVAGWDRTPALRRFARIEQQHGLVRSAGRRFTFDHHLLQEAIYDALPELLREDYHGLLGEALERHWPEQGASASRNPVVVDLCDHFLKGGRAGPARRYLRFALDHLEAGGLHAAAVELADRALGTENLLEGAERRSVLVRKIGRVSLLGRREDERAAIEEMMTLTDEEGEPAIGSTVHYLAGMHLLHTSRYDAARVSFQRALELATRAGDAARERNAEAALGATAMHFGELEEARAHHERALELSRGLGDLEGEARAMGNLGSVAYGAGDYGRALEHFRRDAELCRGAGDRRSEAQSTENLAVIHRNLGRTEEAVDLHVRALSLFRATGDRRGEAIAVGNLANLHADLGRVEEACDGFRQHLSLSREIEYLSGAFHAELRWGSLLAQEGREEEARPHMAAAKHLAELIGSPEEVAGVAVRLALLPGGDPETARDLVERHAAEFGHSREMEFRFAIWHATRDGGQLEAAYRLLCDLRDRVPEEYRESFLENVGLHRRILEARERLRGA